MVPWTAHTYRMACCRLRALRFVIDHADAECSGAKRSGVRQSRAEAGYLAGRDRDIDGRQQNFRQLASRALELVVSHWCAECNAESGAEGRGSPPVESVGNIKKHKVALAAMDFLGARWLAVPDARGGIVRNVLSASYTDVLPDRCRV